MSILRFTLGAMAAVSALATFASPAAAQTAQMVSGRIARSRTPAAPTRAGMPAHGVLVFNGVTVVDVEGGRLVPNQRIVIEGHRIRAVGSARAMPLSRGARIVDLHGKYVVPGLWDMHVHNLATDRDAYLPYAAYVLAGVTGIRDMATPQLDSVLHWRREFAAGTKLGPRVLTPGSSVRYTEPGAPKPDGHQVSVSTPEEGRRVVDSLKQAGADFLKIYPSWGGSPMPREVYIAMLAEARRIGFHVAGHPPLTVPALEALDSGQKSFEHMAAQLGTGATPMGPKGEVPPEQGFFAACWRADSIGDRECAALAAAFVHHNSYFTPTLSVWPLYFPVHPDSARSDTVPPDAYGMIARADFWLLARLHRFGVPLLAGTDWPLRGPGANELLRATQAIHGELALLVAAGLTPLDALRSATLNPAKYWQATDSLGTVATGKLADLLVLDADPLVDIHNTTKIRAVVANGRYFDQAALKVAKADLVRQLEEREARVEREVQAGRRP